MTYRYRGAQPTTLLLKDFARTIPLAFDGVTGVESVGLLVICQEVIETTDGTLISYVSGNCIPVANAHGNPKHHFAVRLPQFRRIQTLPDVLAVVGVAHTHDKNVYPSRDDIDQISDDLLGAVYFVSGGSIRYYTCDGLPRYRNKTNHNNYEEERQQR